MGRGRNSRKILSLDFDGVINSYTSGWHGIDVLPDPPVPGAREFLLEATQYFDVAIYSTRSADPKGIDAMQRYVMALLSQDGTANDGGVEAYNRISWPTTKPPASVGIDDRQLTFMGHWPSMAVLEAFKPWNKGGVDDLAAVSASILKNCRPTGEVADPQELPELPIMATVDHAIAVLNRALEASPGMVDAYLGLMLKWPDGIGLITSIFGTDDQGRGFIGVSLDAEDRIIEFVRSGGPDDARTRHTTRSVIVAPVNGSPKEPNHE